MHRPEDRQARIQVRGGLRGARAAEQARFYSMNVEHDLFGRVVLVRRWGRIGTHGRVRLDQHGNESEALTALAAIKAHKRRRGYAVREVGP